ncbi:MAG: amino acid ABC transporter permease [Clostridiales bacterium]|jgi:His/Glu/Gln/Arg/opine family amino acid ABC transporter permease subunit|nr:amino acid ABC transporter permease [Clostridiales bacterium]
MLKDIFKILSDSELVGYILQGFLNSLAITVIAALLGLLLGFIVAVVKIMPSNKWSKIPKCICGIYTTVFRGTPVALQLFIMVFAVFAIPGFKPYAAILTFGINSGAYVSESIRAGITSVDNGQMEAGRALGMTWFQTMCRIILPQAIKNVIPAIGNEMIALLKETSIIGWIGSTPGDITFDLNAAANTIYRSIPNYLASGVLIGCCYLAVVYVMVFAIKLIEKRFAKNER